MDRFYFHIQDGRLQPDLVGTEFETLQAVRQHAIEIAVATLTNHNHGEWEPVDWQITVTDLAGETVFTLNFYGQN